jgi:GMP synthase (glutamine-hydrolysing)
MQQLLIIQHVAHERLGTFEDAFRRAGCRLIPLNIFEPKAVWPALEEVGGVVSMGGPMSVSQQAAYPWIARELALLRRAVERRLPVLGVCLGAQMLAAALGAKVAPNPQKEIGWYPVIREPGADGDPLLAAFGQTETVFQWHGDTFGLPTGAVRLASSPLRQGSSRRMEQAFRYGDRAWGLQFHVEVTEAMVRAWLRTPVNKAELALLRGVIDPMAIRRQSSQHIGRLQELSRHVATAFATIVQRPPTHSRSATHAHSR